jgi:SM-20-related protein
MLNFSRIAEATIENDPYRWAIVDGLFSHDDAIALKENFPCDHFKTVTGDDGEKGYEYEARALLAMGEDRPAFAGDLDSTWHDFAGDLLSESYRSAMTQLTGIDLSTLTIEANVFHYGRGAWLGPHVDLKEKIVTHIFYFNEAWDSGEGGSLSILGSPNLKDVRASVPPIVGNSVVLVRSDNSWHAVPPVSKQSRISRRSLALTFYAPGSVSTMWPPGDRTPLHTFDEAKNSSVGGPRSWSNVLRRVWR